MAVANLQAWDNVNQVWVKLACDANGYVKIDPTEIFENPPTEDESKKGPTSEWAFDHDADASAHHTKTSDASEITSGVFDDARIPSGVARDAEVTSMIASHSANPSIHHTKTTDAAEITTGTFDDARIPSSIARDSEVTSQIASHTAIAAAHHTKTTDATEITSGVFADARIPSSIARDSEVSSQISSHAAVSSAHHVKTSHADEITAGVFADARIPSSIARDSEVISQINAHAANPSIHHSKTTSSEIDHGSVQGLSDDDHSQYFKTDGSRVLTGKYQGQQDWSYGGIMVKGSRNCYGGMSFFTYDDTYIGNLMYYYDNSYVGFFKEGVGWRFLVDSNNVIIIGSIPWASVNDRVAGAQAAMGAKSDSNPYHHDKYAHFSSGFAAYKTTAQTLPHGAASAIIFNQEYFDLASEFNTTTGKFTASSTGTYIFCGGCKVTDAKDVRLQAEIRLNQSYYSSASQRFPNGGNVENVVITSIANLSVNDQVELYFYLWNYTDATNCSLDTTAQWTFFQGARLF